ncbi:MAG: M20 family metallopeptidase [Anaerolineae bacterium]|nr:M20 family metallopeptidase [Anaerolineae bacterium]
MNHVTDQIYTYLGTHHDDMVAFLKRLVLAESPSTRPETQTVPLALIWEFLNDLDYTIHITPGEKTGGYLTAYPRYSYQRPQQMLIGHCDTVWPLGTLKTMPIDIGDNVMTGPGVYDMKAGLTQMLFALQALHDLELEPAVAPFVFVNSDEEIGSRESRTAIVDLAPTMDRVFVLEPALGPSGKLKTARKGVGQFTVHVTGKAAHAGLDPDKGVSAIWEMAYVIQQLQALNDLTVGISVNVGVVKGGLGSNVIAPEASAVVDVRVPSLAAAEHIKQAILTIKPHLAGTTVTIQGDFGRPPLERTRANQMLWQLAQQSADAIGVTLEEGMAGGGSDGNLTSPYTATLDGMGAVGDGAHAAHEFIYLDKMVERGAILGDMLLQPPLSELAKDNILAATMV